MLVGPGEPAAGPWRTASLIAFARDLTSRRSSAEGRLVIGIDGRSGGGKSTLARRLQSVLPQAAVVSTDDVAWHTSMFGWADLLARGVLAPFRTRHPVRFRPAAWDARNRPGAIEVPDDRRILVVEGVGASQRALTDLLDVAVWVQSDWAEAERKGIARDIASGVNGDAAASVAFWHTWIAAEVDFLEQDAPWERADVIVAGTSTDPLAPDRVAVARRIGQA